MIKEPEMKLFGKTITLPPDEVVVLAQKQSLSEKSASQDSEDVSEEDLVASKQDDESANVVVVVDIETDSSVNKSVESNVSQEKTLSKPDKILPCPRCNSMETKFCYYNNYNVGQPRHFCKKCQRYWTAGGTMRNVPVGSGRRKNKHASVPSYRHIMVSDALQNGMQFASLKPNGFLIFGSDRRLSESAVSSHNPAEKPNNHGGNELYDPSVVSSGVTSISTVKASNANVKQSSFLPPSWPPNTQTTFVPSCFPVTFYPATPYWGCAVPSSWNVPLVSLQSSSSEYSAASTSLSSSTLGKHSIDGTMIKPSNYQKGDISDGKAADTRVLIPKTLRINNPNEAVKSSIWSTLGIENQKIDPLNRTSFFKTYNTKGDVNGSMKNSTLVLEANPAAFSRSINFRETAKCD